jgi:DNA-binding Lrp family transcriptional regulator
MLDATDFQIVNPWQRGFPLAPRPFAAIGEKVSLAEEQVITRYHEMQKRGVIDRVGPVFRPNTVGASSLAAMAVPRERLAAIAALVSGEPGVNHNYEREHRYNLWFVATGATPAEVQATLDRIERAAAIRVLRLPLLEELHIDLGFDLESRVAPRASAPHAPSGDASAQERRLAGAVAAGLPLVPAPYASVAAQLGMAEAEVIALLRKMLEDGRIRRIGAVVRHRRLGYQANAMAVWDVPDAIAGELGRRVAADPAVTLCYLRARALPDWPYNLYCMIHGRERGRVLDELARLGEAHGLDAFAHAVLFSTRCFSQRAALYG